MKLARAIFCLAALSMLIAQAVTAQTTDRVVATSYAPLMIEGNAEFPGYAVEVLTEAAKRAGRSFEITFMPFERAMFMLQSDGATLMPALFYGKKRNDSFLWVAEIERARLRFATISGPINDIETARELPSIAVESGTTADVYLTELGFENLVRVGTTEASSRMLTAGRVDAWFQNERAIEQAWERLETPPPLLMGAVLHEVPIFLTASLGLPEETAKAYREAILSMKADGTLGALIRRYD